MPKENGSARLDEQIDLRSEAVAFFKRRFNVMSVFET